MVKHLRYLFFILVASLLTGCQSIPVESPTSTESFPIETSTSIFVPTALPVSTPTISPKAHMKFQCINITATPPPGIEISGVVILKSMNDGTTFQLNMDTNKYSQISKPDENRFNFKESPDKKLLAYESVDLSKGDKIGTDQLIIASAEGQSLKVIPWENEWLSLRGWVDNQRLAIFLRPQNNNQEEFYTSLILNPFNEERLTLQPDFPRFLNAPSTNLPPWDGWNGVIYDPTFTLAIYPRFIGNDDEMFTYGIWDLEKHELVASLENIFSAFSLFNDTYPMPRWSPDGSQFVFEGVDEMASSWEYELYSVGRDGQVEQLTHLSYTALIQDSNWDWSPDGRYIAMYLNNWAEGIFTNHADVAILDTLTLEVSNTCISIRKPFADSFTAPIWSPDGQQFLVVDWDGSKENNHNHVILVDFYNGFAAQIAEDMEPVGWITSP